MRQAQELVTAAVQAMECENWPLAIEKATEAAVCMLRVLNDLKADENPVIRDRATSALRAIAHELSTVGSSST